MSLASQKSNFKKIGRGSVVGSRPLSMQLNHSAKPAGFNKIAVTFEPIMQILQGLECPKPI